MLFENDNITKVPGIGPALAIKLKRLNISKVRDLIYHIPFRYIDFRNITSIANAEIGQLVTIKAEITKISARKSFKSKLGFTEATLSDDTGYIKVVWFNQPYLQKTLQTGDVILLAGEVQVRGNEKQLVNPIHESVQNQGSLTSKLLPIYPLTSGVSNLQLAKIINNTIPNLEFDEDLIPEKLLKNYNLISTQTALKTCHNPKTLEELEPAYNKLAINELLPQQLLLALEQTEKQNKAAAISIQLELIQNFIKDLPFTLTNSQKRAIWDILNDLALKTPCNRMVIGDVGSGKTIVAIIAALNAAMSSKHILVLAPTEILAKQHYKTFLQFLSGFQINIACLTRSVSSINNKQIQKESLLNAITNKEVHITIGTHALLKPILQQFGFDVVIVDEQHRFGVAQRSFLLQNSKTKAPHFISLSATPIPRSLALALYGHIEVSLIRELPKNKLPIKTEVLTSDNQKVAYQKILSEIKAGNQAFVVMAKVEESDSDVKSVKEEYTKIQKQFPTAKVGILYGSLKPEIKNQVMQDFAEKKYDILVASSVIEVGIDIPNATVIIIEGAERFGLSQLHQLRGRVGRSNKQSYCYVIVSPNFLAEVPRLTKFTETSDGFVLSEFDLKTRGFGQLVGTSQSGYTFKFPTHLSLQALKQAQKIAKEITALSQNLNDFSKLQQQVEILKSSAETDMLL